MTAFATPVTLGTYTNVSSTAITGSDPVLETISGTDDADYAYDSTNSTHTGQARFTLENLPVDFLTMNTLSIQLRYGLSTALTFNTWDSLRARIYQSDGTTALTDEVTVASSITTTTAANSLVTAFTGVNTTANASVWTGAQIHLYWGITRTKGGDTAEERVYAAELTGDYDIDSGQTLTAPYFQDTPDTFYAPTVVPGPVSLTAPFFDDTPDTFNAHTLTTLYTITAPFFDDTPDTFNAHTLTLNATTRRIFIT